MDRHLHEGQVVTPLFHKSGPMKNQILIDLLKYWERLRAGRVAPLRSELDPREIEGALEHAFILERVAVNNVRIRLAGMQLCDLLGMEIRGMPPTALFDKDERTEFSRIINTLFVRPEIIELKLLARRKVLPDLAAEMLLLPMKNDQGKISRVLGCLVTDGPIGPPPQRFSIASKKITRIVATETGSHADLLPGFAEPSTNFVHAGQNKGSDKSHPKPYLRLVVSDD